MYPPKKFGEGQRVYCIPPFKHTKIKEFIFQELDLIISHMEDLGS